MAFWLLKSEPDAWSWDQQVARGARGEPWTGVRNHQAKLHLMAMREGEEGFFYHSRQGLEIMGRVRIIRAAYPDPTAEPGTPWVAVDVVAGPAFAAPVPLSAIKAEPSLAEMVLIKNSRLSVQPVTPTEWQTILAMGGSA